MMKMKLTPCQGSAGDDDGVEFPSVVASEQQDQPSPEDKRTVASSTVSENYVKIRSSFFT
jgi:hypothetical protein